ncbi:UNVERIFIED_CONTAM: hypothetical protein GTU68_056368 [Idotea baltica]|nr:hypothetical protein [Idotea baltica]
MTQTKQLIASAQRTIKLELEAIESLLTKINSSFTTACELILKSKGRLVVLGMGKSGHIGRKIAATLASTGTTAFFVHPAEASHGDMGMIDKNDIVLALSNSGTTAEILTLLPLIKRSGITLISMTGNPNSLLSQEATVNLDASIEKEACPLNLAPTSSTTASLVLGDALAIALLEARGFTAEDFAFSHPGGALGKRLLLKVEHIMHTGQRLPIVSKNTLLRDALVKMTQKGLGLVIVIDESSNTLIGVFTDGDLRRAFEKNIDLQKTTVDEVMTSPGHVVSPDILAAEALKIMEDNKINALVVTNQQGLPLGAINMHDLLHAGVL